MKNVIKRYFGKACLAATLALTAAIPVSSTALAQDSLVRDPPHYEEIPGCDQNVYNAIKYVGQVNAIRDVQLAEETLLKPESVFLMTCFALDSVGANQAGDQIANAGRTINANDRFLWRQTNSNPTGGWAGNFSERADEKVRNYTRTWLNNYASNILENEVDTDCANLQNLWTFLTGNGAKRILTDQNGNPDPGGSVAAGPADRQDDAFFISTFDIWNGNDYTGANTTDSVPVDAWGIQDQTTTVIEGLADAAINQLEEDQFNRTDAIQTDIIDIGYLDYTCTEFAGPAPGCAGFADPTDCHGMECLIGQNILDLFTNL